MADLYYLPSKWNQLRRGPLGPHIENYARLLASQGYALFTGRWKLRLIGRLSQWLDRQQLAVCDLDEDQITKFLKGRKRAVHRQGARPTLVQLLQLLRDKKIIADCPPVDDKPSPTEVIIKNYSNFLEQERGLSLSTVHNYSRIVRPFLERRFKSRNIDFKNLSVGDISDFIVEYGSAARPGRIQLTSTVLRSFLGFLLNRGEITRNLGASVPSVAKWQLAELPKYLEPADVEKILNTCDQHTSIGRRDYVVLLLMARLGLRAGEIRDLTLEDIHWASGEVLIRGKSAREDRLPLVAEVGSAMAKYLKTDRPTCSSRRVFIRSRAPFVGFFGSAAIENVLQRALVRADLNPPSKGAGLLRCSLATRMLGGGASMSQIAEVLRHQLPQTTEIYAKVNLAALRALAQPWPRGAR